MEFQHQNLAQRSSWPFLKQVQPIIQYGDICMKKLFGIVAFLDAFPCFCGTAIGTSTMESESESSSASPASGLLSSAAFAISSSSSLLELLLVVLSDSSSSLKAAKTAEVSFGAALGCVFHCGHVSAGAGKVLVDFHGGMVLERDRKRWEAGKHSKLAVTLI